MQNRERYADDQQLYRVMQEAHQAGIWTSMPGIVVSFDAGACTASVRPAIKGQVLAEDGTQSAIDMPLCVDVPIVFMHGGGMVMTMPVAAGDECLLVFGSRCIDGWWATGKAIPPMDSRQHDLSDAIAIVGPFSKGKAPAGINPHAAELRTIDGRSRFSLDASGAFTLTVGGAPIFAVDTAGAVTFSGPSIKHNGRNIGADHTHPEHDGGNTSGPNP